jgi:hypothetical protein
MTNGRHDEPQPRISLPSRSWFNPSPLTIAVAVAGLVGAIGFVSQCSGQ